MLADITVKVSEFQASGRKLEQQLIYLRTIQKNFTQEEKQKLSELVSSVDQEVDRLYQFIENDKKSRVEKGETKQSVEAKMEQQKAAEKKLEQVQKVQKQWYPRVWNDLWLHPYSVYEGITPRQLRTDVKECLIHPLSLLAQVWNSFQVLFALMLAICLPIGLGFPSQEGLVLPLVLTWTAIKIIDTFLLLNAGVIIEQELDMNPKSVFRYHWTNGNLIFNCITGFPYILIVDAATTPDSPYRVFGRLVCIINGFGFIRLLLESRNGITQSKITQLVRYYEVNQSMVKFVQIVSGMAFYCHWFSCAVRLLQRYSFIHDYVESPFESEYYITSFFESASIMFSAAWGVAIPITTAERWPKVVNMLMSTFLYALFTANITAFMVRLDSSGRLFAEKLEEVNQYLKYKGVGRDIHERIIQYYRFKYSQGKYFDEDRILSELNEPLRAAISLRECRSLITSVPFFKDADQRFVTQVVTILRICHYLSEDLILEHETTGDQMFFIESGNVEVVVQGKTVAVLGPGNYFGEISLLFGHMKRTASVRAITNCVLYSLSQSELEKILELNPDIANIMRNTAEERIRMNQVVIMGPQSTGDAYIPIVDQTYLSPNERKAPSLEPFPTSDRPPTSPLVDRIQQIPTPERLQQMDRRKSISKSRRSSFNSHRPPFTETSLAADEAVRVAQSNSFILPMVDPALIRENVILEQPDGAPTTPSTAPSSANANPRRQMLLPSRSFGQSSSSFPAPGEGMQNETSIGSKNTSSQKSIPGGQQDGDEKVPIFIEHSVGPNTDDLRKGSFRLKDANSIFSSASTVDRIRPNSNELRGKQRSGTITNRRGVEIHSLKGNIPTKDQEQTKPEAPALPLIDPAFLAAKLDPNSDSPATSLKFIQVEDSTQNSSNDAHEKSNSISTSLNQIKEDPSPTNPIPKSPLEQRKEISFSDSSLKSSTTSVTQKPLTLKTPHEIVVPPVVVTAVPPIAKPERPPSLAEAKKRSFLGVPSGQAIRSSPLRYSTRASVTASESGDSVRDSLRDESESKTPNQVSIQIEIDSSDSPSLDRSLNTPSLDASNTAVKHISEPSNALEPFPSAKGQGTVTIQEVNNSVSNNDSVATGSPKSAKYSIKKGINLRVLTNSNDLINASPKSVPEKPLLAPSKQESDVSLSMEISITNPPKKPREPMVEIMSPISPTAGFAIPVGQPAPVSNLRRKTFADITMGKNSSITPPKKWTWRRFWNHYQPSTTYCPLHPNMFISKIWSSIFQLSFLLVSILLPISFGFEEERDLLPPISIFVTLISLIDFAIKMQTGILIFDEYEMDPRKLANRYLKNGTFLFDFITAVPWVFIIDATTTGETREYTRLICLVHCLPLLRGFLDSRKSILAEMLTNYVRKNDINSSAVQAVKILFAIIFYWHWHSCSANYIMRMNWAPNPFPTLTGVHGYVLHFWASATEMLNAGCGAVPPAVSLDRVLKVFNMICNATLVALYVGNISSFMIGLDSSGRQFNEQLEQVSQFVTYKGLGRELKRRILDYYQFKYSQGKYFDETRILQELNESLRMSIYMRECRALVVQVPFFKGADNGFISQVVMILKPEHYLSGDVVIEKGSAGDLMFFIASGMLEVIVNDKVVAKLGPGQFFGEITLLFGHMRRTATIRAMTNCNLYSLSRSELNYILEMYPDMAESIRKTAEERMVKDLNRK